MRSDARYLRPAWKAYSAEATANGQAALIAAILEATIWSPKLGTAEHKSDAEKFQTIASIAETTLAMNDATSARSLRLIGHGIRGTVG